jgi:ribulose-bisphosphate carboxylase large chain
MVIGLPAFNALAREYRGLAFMAHPALAGALRFAPPALLGKLFRLFGADATIFPNHGGRFGYTPETCRALADAARAPWHGLRACVPVPAGGMTTERVPEMLDFYGPDTILLIGGNLLAAGERLTEKTAEFVSLVKGGR